MSRSPIRQPAELPAIRALDTWSDPLQDPSGIDSLQRGDLVEGSAVPPVVCLEEVQDLLARVLAEQRAGGEALDPDLLEELAEYVERYYVGESENRRALSMTLTALTRNEGRGFIINGLYGSGKSHFLAVLALLAALRESWPLFLQSHPEYQELSRHFWGPAELEPCSGDRAPLLVLVVPLDAHRGAEEDLEDIVFAEAERALLLLDESRHDRLSRASFALSLAEERLLPLYRDQLETWLSERMTTAGRDPVASSLTEEWNRLRQQEPALAAGLAAEFARTAGVPLDWHEPRRERLHRLLQAAAAAGRRGVLVLLDELSLFLTSKPRDRFSTDVSFLQFLGQQSRYYPLWITAAVQRGIEEVGDIDADTLHKLKDRYAWDLTLSMAQLRPVLAHKLVRKKDPERFHLFMEELWRRESTGTSPPQFGLEELAEIYPLHPLALRCLAEVSNRFFSKTRSVVQFVLRAVQEDACRPAAELVGPDQVFQHFWMSVAESPELRPTFDACAFYEKQIAGIYPEDPAYALRLVRGLAALALAGLRQPVRELAAAIPPPADLSPDSRVVLAHAVLETLRRNGGYVDVIPGEDSGDHVYFFDAGCDLPWIIRRRLAACAADLEEGDSRALEFAYRAASDAALPLQHLARPARVEVDWLTVRHLVSVERRDLRHWSLEEALELIRWLEDPRQPETLCLLVGELNDPRGQASRVETVSGQLPDDRWRWAIAAWIPRPLSQREWNVLREYAAFCLLMEDPTLRANGIGRQILARLRSEKAARDAEVRELVRSAYAGGELFAAGRAIAGSADLHARASRLEDAAGIAASRMLPEIFPDFIAVAPRRRLTARPSLQSLLHELVLPGGAPLRPGSPLDGLIRDTALPLGIVTVEENRYVLCDPSSGLIELALSLLPDGAEAAWADLAGGLAKSRFGLSREQAELLVAALVRRGHLTAFDQDRARLPAAPTTVPFSISARSFRRSEQTPHHLGSQMEILARALEPGRDLLPEAAGLPAAEQERLWSRVRDLKATAAGSGLKQGLSEVIRELDGQAERWRSSIQLIDAWEALWSRAPDDAAPATGLRSFLESLSPESLQQIGACYQGWLALRRFTAEEGPALARLLRVLTHPLFALPPASDLDLRRSRLLKAVEEGESVVARAPDAVRYANAILERYRDEYVDWHTRTFSESRFAPYRRLAALPGWTALEKLETLPIPPLEYRPGSTNGESSTHGGGSTLQPEALATDAIRRLVEAQLGRQCSSGGLHGALLRGPVCPSCRLPLGAEVEVLPVSSVEEWVREGVWGRMRSLQEPIRMEKLQHHRARIENRPELLCRLSELLVLLGARDPRPSIETLDRLLDDDLVYEVRRALAAGETAPRSVGELRRLLGGREYTRVDAIRVFTRWLDPESSLAPEAYVRFED